MRAWPALVAIILATAPAAAAPRRLCDVGTTADYRLDEAVAAVFPTGRPRSTAADCADPLKLLHYGDADVLLTKKGGPDDNVCHGCGGVLSAYVLRRTPDGLRLAASFVDFDESGSNGDAGRVEAIQLAGHDALSIESGGTFQGYTAVTVAFFVFRDGRLDALGQALPLSASNGGAVTDDAQAISVDGAWRIDAGRPDAVTIDYRVKTGRGSRRASVTWVLKDATLALSSGQVPDEYAAATGQ